MEKPLKNPKLVRALIYIALFVVIAALIYFSLKSILPGFIEVLETGDQQRVEDYIRSFVGIKGALIALLLQFVQVVSILCPGGPIQIAAGVVFGTLMGYAVCEAGYLIANLTVFALSRRLGAKMDALFPMDSEKKSRFGFLTNSSHPAFMTFMGCMMPFLPNGIVPHLAARTNIKAGPFLLAVFLGSTPTYLWFCIMGNRLLQGDFTLVVILGGGFLIVVALLLWKKDALTALAGRWRDKAEEWLKRGK